MGNGNLPGWAGKPLRKCVSFLLVLGVQCHAATPLLGAAPCYHNFWVDPLPAGEMQSMIAPWLLPADHPARPKLDAIFSQSRVVENKKTLVDAGFEIIADTGVYSFMIVARHPEIPGVVFKLYLDSESRCRKGIPYWKWLIRRCEGARAIKKVIRRHKIRHFSVPDKWLYVFPTHPLSRGSSPKLLLLIETDMQPESREVSRRMWKTAITRKHLDELYSILRYGYGGSGVISLAANVPFTKSGTFAFTDTEDPRSKLKLEYVKKYLSTDMQNYWDRIVK